MAAKKKGAKKKSKDEEAPQAAEAPAAEEVKPAKKKKAEPEAEPVAAAPQEEAAPAMEEEAREDAPTIDNIKVERLEGPKILGKISLPTPQDRLAPGDEKRKRKRIPIERKDTPSAPRTRE